jgi:hypothetical protein
MAYYKELKGDELYLYMNGKLIYKRWLNTGQSKVFDKMAYDKYTLVSINDSTLRKKQFMDEHIFFGLTNLNTGFDNPLIQYFSEEEFRIVLQRCEKLGLGIFGIEPWINGSFYDVKTYESYSDNPMNPKWYQKAFDEFTAQKKTLQYAASYYIPELNDQL